MCRDKLLEARGWTVLRVPYFAWLQCHEELALQQAYLRRLLLGYVDTGTHHKHAELKSTGRSTNNSNASTDDEECGTAFDQL